VEGMIFMMWMGASLLQAGTIAIVVLLLMLLEKKKDSKQDSWRAF
jgi:hypothetical protein